MESIETAARDYEETLAELKCNNKTQINLLTILAEDFKQAAPQIVDVIERHLNTCSPAQKLPVLYVCDSILKNVGKPNEYDNLFSRKIVPMFEHVFRQGDEKVRQSLYKLRVTWASTELFIPSKLYALDMKINRLDNAWPISNPHTGRALRDDPKVTVVPKAPPTSSVTSPPSTSAAASSSTTKVYVNPKFMDGKGDKGKVPSTSAAASVAVKEKVIKKEPKQDPLDKLLPTASKPSTSLPAKRKSTPLDHPNAPFRKKAQQSTPPKKTDEDLRAMPKKAPKDQDLRPKSLKPTSVIGSHAFAPAPAPSAPRPPPAAPQQSVRQIPIPPSQPAPPAAHFTPNVAPFLAPPKPFQHRSSPPQEAPVPAPQQQPAPSHVYSSEQPKLDVPANNRIFVDGKAYEVMFVDDTAVIERGGAPHRIYFAGPPRNLIIDGVPHLLPFDQPTQIDILGAKHVVKFGAPSRELYIGGHPFRGQFGGPPIVATINGRRHEIRLTGSAPEVRIEPEPVYHLTHFLHKMREEKKIEIASEKPEKKEDWLSYLQNLKKSGILPPLRNSSASPRHQTPPPSSNNGQRGPPRPVQLPPHQRWGSSSGSSAPPPPSPQSERRAPAPPAAIADFNIRLLQVRYDSVVEALCTKRADSCKFCGMRLDDSCTSSKQWQDHMDWHVQQNLTSKFSNTGSSTSTNAPYRQWYPSAENWLTAKNGSTDNSQASEGEEKEEEVPGVVSSGVKKKECSVCGEKFEEYYDDEEETWRLRDTVSIHGKIVHSSCSADASRSFDASFDVKKEEETDEDYKMIIPHSSSSSSSIEKQRALSRS